MSDRIPIPGQVRFEAQWITKQYVDAHGEGNPDKDEYVSSYHLTRDEAESAALVNSKRARQCEWFLIAEQKYSGHTWTDQRRWTGDWENGVVDQTFALEEGE